MAQGQYRRPANKPKLPGGTDAASESAGANPTAAVWLGNCIQSDGAYAMKEWNEHMFYAAIEIGLFCFNECHLLSSLLPAERPAVDHPCNVSEHAGSRRPGCQQAIGVLGVAIHPDTATLHLQLERHRELAMQV